MHNIEEIHSQVLAVYMDKGGISRYIRKYFARDYYPVLIGGINVKRCADMEPKARELIGSLYTHDIDIKFVIVKDIIDNTDPAVVAAHEARLRFVNEVSTDEISLSAVRSIEKAYKGLRINLKIHEMKKTRNEILRRNIMINFNAEYYIDGVHVGTKEIIDTGIYSNYSQEEIMSYRKFFANELNRPIPFYVHKGIPYATCGWAYYDTIKMLVLYGQRYETASDPKERRYQFEKLLKYIGKFLVLYTQLNRIRGDSKFDNIKRVYVRSKWLLKKLSFQTDATIPRRKKQVMEELLNELDNNTDVTRLKEILIKGIISDKGFNARK